MNKILLTGATGFIGRQCIPVLVEKGYEVHAVSSGQPGSGQEGVRWHRCDLLDPHETTWLMEKTQPSFLLHFAWYAEPGKYWTSMKNFDWVQAGLNLMKSFHESGGKRIVMAGSCAEYDWNHGYCIEQITPLAPATTYGKCKHALQILLDSYSKQSGLSSAWGRIFYAYGPYEHKNRLVASVISSLLENKPAKCSHGLVMRDFLHVQDIANAFVALLESDVRGAVNIGSGIPVLLKNLVLKIACKLEKPDLVQFGALQAPKDEARLLVADIQRLSEEVKWKPEFDLDSGLDHAINWWKAAM